MDTTTIHITDSSHIIKGEQQSIILIQDNRKEQTKDWFESPIVGSFLLPILVTIISAWVIFMLRKKKYDVEIIKLQEETKQLKDHLKPQIIASLQETQKHLLELKLEALKQLAIVRDAYFRSENFFYEGQPFLDEADDYYQVFFNNASGPNFLKFQKFITDFEYLFPQSVIDHFNKLKHITETLYESNLDKNSTKTMEPDEKDKKLIDDLVDNFKHGIAAMREDLQLDNTFIQQYLKENSTK